MKIVPEESWLEIIEEVLKFKKILLIGATDCGKSTFAKYVLIYSLKKGLSLTFIDSDIGQSSIALPGTIGLKKIEKIEDINSFADILFFVGFTSPSISINKFLHAFSQAVQKANSFNIPVLIDTTGFVTEGGIALKIKKCEIFKPELVIAFQRQKEIEPILKEIKTQHIILKPSENVIVRDKIQRAHYREQRFQEYFKNAECYLFYSKLIENIDKNFLYHKSMLIGRVVGLYSESLCMGVGYIEDIDEKTVIIKTPSKEIEKIKKIVLGNFNIAEIAKNNYND